MMLRKKLTGEILNRTAHRLIRWGTSEREACALASAGEDVRETRVAMMQTYLLDG